MSQFWRYTRTLLKVAFRHPITGVTLIPRLEDGRLVLIQRRDTGQWGLPGGLVDWGETLTAAARRELKEETGLELAEAPRLAGVYSDPERDPRMHSISILLAVEATGELRVEDGLEVIQAEAFPLSELPLGNLSHDHDRQLRDYLAGNIEVG
ncbi:MAG: NUDIX hydrolase [Cyanobacteriota bacterium]|nr:NUDIX hydrolase [Cyanobacteriota bacterium]